MSKREKQKPIIALFIQTVLLTVAFTVAQILPETGSGNTIENMRFSKRLIEERSEHARVAFATTNYHVFRSGIISRQEDFYPYGMGAKTA